MAEHDLSGIINLIMENPELIEKIKSLADSSAENEKKAIPKSESYIEEKLPPPSENATRVASSDVSDTKIRRRELLRALKPYLSPERGEAIESMLRISDVLEIMKDR